MKFPVTEKTGQRAIQLYEWAKAIDPFNLGVSAFLVLVAIFFSLPAVVLTGIGSAYTHVHYELTTARAIGYATMGIVSFAVAYYAASRRNRDGKVLGQFRYDWNNKCAWMAFAALFGGGFLIKILRILSGQLSSQYLDLNDPLFLLKFMISLNTLHYMGIAVAFVSYFHLLRNNDAGWKAWRNVSWVTTAIAIVFALISTNGRLSLITPILIYLIAKHYLYSRSYRRIITAALVVVLILFPAKMIARDYSAALNHYFAGGKEVLAWHKPKSITEPRHNWDFIDSLLYSGALDKERYLRLEVNAENVSALTMDASVGRLGQLHIFSAVVENTDNYLYGRNIPYLLNHLGVPNSLIEKIVGIGAGTEFSVKYGISGDPLTGIGATQMGDLYMNFGPYGIALGMAVLGLLYRKIYDLHVAGAYPSGIFVYTLMWIALLHGQEQTLSAAYGRALQFFLILFVIQFFISRAPLFGKPRLLDRGGTPSQK